jgi:succinoglycan biosynthesis transport protein ExoP
MTRILQAGHAFGDPTPVGSGRDRPRGPNPRLIAFGLVFVLVSLAGLGYTFLRPAEYRATARVEIRPAEDLSVRVPDNGASDAAVEQRVSRSFLGELQVLTSRPLLLQLAQQLRAAGLVEAGSDGEAITALQSTIAVVPVAGTQVVALTAIGTRAQALAPALNGLLQIYQAEVAARYQSRSNEALKQARDEAARYEAAVAAKRAAMAAFGARHDIVSLERDENETLAQVKGLGVALTTAEDKAAAADAHVQALKEAIAAGQAPVRAKDSPTLAGAEARLSQAEEEYRQLERGYTGDYLAMDPKARGLKTRIAELQAQVRQERSAGQQANLADAQEERVRTHEVVTQLRARLAAGRQSAQAFAARFSEFKAQQDELNRLDGLAQNARELVVRLQASEDMRQPQVNVIEAAATPLQPWRPLVLRDSAITLGAAIVLGAVAAWLTAFLTRRDDGPSVVVAPTAFAYPVGIAGPGPAPVTLDAAPTAPALTAAGAVPQLTTAMRELDEAEVVALLRACDPTGRAIIAALLSGIAPDELLRLRWPDVDAATIRIAAPHAREFAPTSELARVCDDARAAARDGAGWVVPAPGAAPTAADLDSVVASAAHDAGIDRAAEVTPAALRHACLAFLARQGARFSELPTVVGPLSAGAIAFYAALAPAGPRRGLDQIDRVVPGLRQWLAEALPTIGPAGPGAAA